MSKKNRKNNKNKKQKGKESGGRDSSTNGGSNNHNINNNHNNNISIPTVVDETVVATTTTTAILTQTDREYIENKLKLKGFPLSNYFVVGYRAIQANNRAIQANTPIQANTHDLAIDACIRGTEKDGCVGCMYLLGYLHHISNNIHLKLPWALECSIRGHTESMAVLITQCLTETKPTNAPALSSFWVKLRIDLGDTNINEETRKEVKKSIADICYVCKKIDSNNKTFEKCSICKYYSYCGKKCQTYHWQEQNHMGECRHLKILRTCCKPKHVREIREAIINGDNPKEIPRLQNLRTALGLNRPKEEYEELLLRLGDDSNIQDQYNYLTARKDGTIHIGSTPNVI